MFRQKRIVIIVENTVSRTLHIVVLAASYRPEKKPHHNQTDDDNKRQKPVDHIHFSSFLLTIRTREALRMTASELIGMATAATTGETNPAIAKGTMMTL